MLKPPGLSLLLAFQSIFFFFVALWPDIFGNQGRQTDEIRENLGVFRAFARTQVSCAS